MTEAAWATHEPPWLAQLRPDLVDDVHAPTTELTPEQRAARLTEQLERAAAGHVPPALAGPGWADADVAQYSEEPTQPVMRPRVAGPWPCQLPQPKVCDQCGREFPNDLRLSIHAANHRREAEREERRRDRKAKADKADKPKPGARKKRKKHR